MQNNFRPATIKEMFYGSTFFETGGNTPASLNSSMPAVLNTAELDVTNPLIHNKTGAESKMNYFWPAVIVFTAAGILTYAVNKHRKSKKIKDAQKRAEHVAQECVQRIKDQSTKIPNQGQKDIGNITSNSVMQ